MVQVYILNGRGLSPSVTSEWNREGIDIEALRSYEIHAAFYQYLASLDNWEQIADGHFDRAVAVEMRDSA